MEKLEQVLYSPAQIGQIQVYKPKSLETLSVVSLYTGNIDRGAFAPSSSYGLGPGIAREIDVGETKIVERFRAGKHEDYGKDHVNLEYYLGGLSKPLFNTHINLKDK